MDSSTMETPSSPKGAPRVPEGVDEADMTFPPPNQTNNALPDVDTKPGLDTVEQQEISRAQETEAMRRDGAAVPIRPGLQRGNLVPAPQQPPPPAPPQDPSNPTDSLSLVQLKKLVNEMPKVEPTPYAFEYEDSGTLPEELEEWFAYATEEHEAILRSLSSFALTWSAWRDLESSISAYESGSMDWCETHQDDRKAFTIELLSKLVSSSNELRLRNLEALVYLVLGSWYETAGREASAKTDLPAGFAKSAVQLEWIEHNVETLANSGGLQIVFDLFRNLCDQASASTNPEQQQSVDEERILRQEIGCVLTIIYFSLEAARDTASKHGHTLLRQSVIALSPKLLNYLPEVFDKMRWDESVILPKRKIILLTWKTVMVTFGGIADVKRAKAAVNGPAAEQSDDKGQPFITASPLDYHVFRQEITSKYPAYNPPPPLFPLEPEIKSILPPVRDTIAKDVGGGIGSWKSGANGQGVSILNQPVHIATPAPSPPPSPAGPGGKGGKKQNYQTNQLFPFLYPPLDESSNILGGKGTTGLQDALVGRKWEGTDIPTSILEAAELFAKRMRATRSMKQLWQERVQFMKYERGWRGSAENADVDKLDLASGAEALASEERKAPRQDYEEEISDEDVKARLEAVDSFYSDTLPHLQSMVIVCLRVILNSISALIAHSNGQNNLRSGLPDGQPGDPSNLPEVNGFPNGDHAAEGAIPAVEDLNEVRSQEIASKAVSGLLILLLKWFKVSHVLKFEFLTQLIVDASYIPMFLKLLQQQEIERVVNYKCDREDLNLFQFCRENARKRNEAIEESDDSDEAVPPPIRLRRDDPPAPTGSVEEEGHSLQHPPEVDELGFPTSELPAEPITDFSWRNFFSTINFLRIMQKLCKDKAHRNLMLVHYKSSQWLKKCLKVPQPELRLYTLKLFKHQVPYCGRKWRQSNMRVITAVYLHCRPELRDDWLLGSEVDSDMEDALPLEQAMRALTHWHNLKRYPEMMGAARGVLEEEQDFFAKELEKLGHDDDIAVGEEALDQGWEGPLQMDAW